MSPTRAGKSALGPALGALFLLVAFHILVGARFPIDPLQLGYHTIELSPSYSRFLGAYLFFGLAAATALVLAVLAARRDGLLPADLGNRLREQLLQGPDRSFVLAVSLLALAIGCLSHTWLLVRMPLTDDEAAYRLGAQILARGQLYLPPDPDQHFFDHVFVVNEDRVFVQYFLGWPALLVPAIWAGMEGYANAIFFALTLPALFLILHRLADSFWARFGCLLALTSPMFFISAGTLLSHTSCITFLAWFIYGALRCREPDAGLLWHAGTAVAFAVAFCIRPLSALGFGLPLLLGWLWDLRGRPRRLPALAAFVAPALFFALLFLWINTVLAGHPLRTAYTTFFEYRSAGLEPGLAEPELSWISLRAAVSTAAAAFHRLNFATLGWPCSWLFVFFAGSNPFRRRLLLSIFVSFLAHLPVTNVGMDTYAPMHYLELGLPMVLLTVLGIENLTLLAGKLDLTWVPTVAAAASLTVTLTAYLPYQLDAVHKVALLEKIARHSDGLIEAPAVVFVKQPYYTRHCFPGGLKTWVHQWPINDPDLSGEVLWLAHLSLAQDRELMSRRFPERKGYLATWEPESCRRLFVPVEEARPEDFPPVRGRVKL